MKKVKKINGKGAGLLASLLGKVGISPLGESKYLRGMSLTGREELKAISGSEFMMFGAVVIPVKWNAEDEASNINTIGGIVNRTCLFGDHLETFWMSDQGEVVRRPVATYEGNPDPVAYALWQKGRGTGLMDKIACAVIPGRVFGEVKMNFGPYMFVGIKVQGSKHLEFVRISLPVVQDKKVLTWFRQLYAAYEPHVF